MHMSVSHEKFKAGFRAFNRGFTLVEVFITIGVFLLIMGAVAAFESNVFIHQRSISGSFRTAQDAQILLKTMLKELRGMEPGANGAYALVSAATSSVSFFADPGNDGTTEEITYFLATSTLYRGVIQPSGSPATYNPANQVNSPIVTNVRNSPSTPLFQYFDTNYNGTSSPLSMPVTVTAVRLIKINLTLDVDINRSPQPVTYSAQANLRNLKTNL